MRATVRRASTAERVWRGITSTRAYVRRGFMVPVVKWRARVLRTMRVLARSRASTEARVLRRTRRMCVSAPVSTRGPTASRW